MCSLDPMGFQTCFISAGSGHHDDQNVQGEGKGEEKREEWGERRGRVSREGLASIPSVVGQKREINGGLLVPCSPSQETQVFPTRSPQMLLLSSG